MFCFLSIKTSSTPAFIEAFPLHIATFHGTRWEFGVFMGFLDAESTRILPKFHGLLLVFNLPIASLLYTQVVFIPF